LTGLSAGPDRAFAAGLLAAVLDWARIAFPAGGLEDFLRVILDIRLPFVAFGGSIIGVLRAVQASSNRADRWAYLKASEYGYKEFDVPPACGLNVLLGPDDASR
jgi:hypothetical protein